MMSELPKVKPRIRLCADGTFARVYRIEPGRVLLFTGYATAEAAIERTGDIPPTYTYRWMINGIDRNMDDDCDLCFGIMSRACPRCNPLALTST
jgi:hypothetical protein